jgi:chromosome segregation ATPase
MAKRGRHKARYRDPAIPAEYYRERMERSRRAITDALDRLVKGHPTHRDLKDTRYKITVTSVAKEANVSRTTIHAYPDLHERINEHKKQKVASANTATKDDKIAELKERVAELETERRKLATQNAALVKRADDAEQKAERLEREKQDLTRQLSKLRQPTAIQGGQE